MIEKDYIPAFNYMFLTPAYDFLVNLFGFGYKERERIVKLLKLKDNEKLLDVGCGTGSLIIVAKKLHPKNEITGIDIDDKILKIAQRKIQKNRLNIKLIKANANKQPFNNESFDVIVSSLIFHHLPIDIKKGAVKDIKRLLKNNGRFLLVDFGKTSSFWIKSLYYFEKLFHIKEAETFKENIDGIMPSLLKNEGFELKQVAPKRYNAIEYILATKIQK